MSSADNKKPTQVLLIDAVVWSAAYPAAHPLRNVGGWYARWVAGLPGVSLRVMSAEAEVVRPARGGVQGVILSGAPRDAWSDDPLNEKLCDVILVCRDFGVPFLGVCYGHQLLARALGGVVAPHPDGLELGNITVQLTAAGTRSPLFSGLPAEFEVLSSHADAVLELPPNCELLATGLHTHIQAFQRDGLLFGVQFHPETDPDVLRFIWSVRRDRWRDKVNFDLDHALDTLRPAPLAAKVLQNFVNRVVQPRSSLRRATPAPC
ncbi:MAG: type 1 glutamine amidotransferase [Verrucomicrobia bacterium]|nr:type 1 glutamine amidotransferase [Verrucomicrobiota bacterium]